MPRDECSESLQERQERLDAIYTIVAVIVCHGDDDPRRCFGPVGLNVFEYEWQVGKPNEEWICPRCGSNATYDEQFSKDQLTPL